MKKKAKQYQVAYLTNKKDRVALTKLIKEGWKIVNTNERGTVYILEK